jgi:hypothetical protein
MNNSHLSRPLPPPTRHRRPAAPWVRLQAFANHWMTPLLGATAALLLLALATAPAAADAPNGITAVARSSALPDPTRPPTALRSAEAAATGASSAAGTGTLQLQSVRLGQGADKGKAPVAIINGQVLAVGDTLGEWRLQRLNEHAAWLAGPQGVLVLALHPGVERAPARSEVPSAPGVPAAATLKARHAWRPAATRTDDNDRPAAPPRSLEPR